MIGVILGVFTILLGAKAFTPKGLPLTKSKNLTGTTAKVIGVVCIVLGGLFIVDGVFGTARIISTMSGSRRGSSRSSPRRIVPATAAEIIASRDFKVEYTTKSGVKCYTRAVSPEMYRSIPADSKDREYLAGDEKSAFFTVPIRDGRIAELNTDEALELLTFVMIKMKCEGIETQESACSEQVPVDNRLAVPQPTDRLEKTITNWIGMKLVLIPAGEFMMGSQEPAEELVKAFEDYGKPTADRFADEYPRHRVRITKPFYLGAYEVTVAQFRQFVSDLDYKTEAEKDGKGGLGYDGESLTQKPEFTGATPASIRPTSTR